jgi:hypothetical protein
LTFFNDVGVEKDFTDDGIVQIRLDQSNYQAILFLKRKLFSAYREFSADLLEDCGKFREAANLPILFEAIYGSIDTEFKMTIVPGILIR